MKRATFVGGREDGQQIAISSGDLPAVLVMDTETYRLGRSGRYCRYFAERRWGALRRFDAQAKAAVVTAIAGGATVAAAARFAGFSPATIYRTLKLDADFGHAYDAAQRRKRSGAIDRPADVQRDRGLAELLARQEAIFAEHEPRRAPFQPITQEEN